MKAHYDVENINKITTIDLTNLEAANEPVLKALVQNVNRLERKIDALQQTSRPINDTTLWNISEVGSYLGLEPSTARKIVSAPDFPLAYRPQLNEDGRRLQARYLAKDIIHWALRQQVSRVS